MSHQFFCPNIFSAKKHKLYRYMITFLKIYCFCKSHTREVSGFRIHVALNTCDLGFKGLLHIIMYLFAKTNVIFVSQHIF